MSESKLLRFSLEAMEDIAREVMAAYCAIPKRGAETGGLLLGDDSNPELEIRDFEPVVCSHRFGPSFVLDDAECKELEESLAFFGRAADALPVAGLYRSNTRPAVEPGPRDQELFLRHFPGRSTLFLLLHPSRSHRIHADIWKWTQGDFQPVVTGLDFPLPEGGAVSLCAGAVPPLEAIESVEAVKAVPTLVASVLPQGVPPPPAPRSLPETLPKAATELAEPKPSPVSSVAVRSMKEPPARVPATVWLLRVAAALMVLSGGYLGFQMARSNSLQSRDTVMAQAPASAVRTIADKPPQVAAVIPPEPAQSTGSAPPEEEKSEPEAPAAVAENLQGEIRKLLDEWAAAYRLQGPEQVSSFYAPQLKRYLGRNGVTRKDVTQSVAALTGLYGAPVIFRISDVRLKDLGNDHATATFRRRWQTKGPRMVAGEEERGLSLVRGNGQWKIVAEDVLHVYWTHGIE